MALDEARMAISDKHANIRDISQRILKITRGKYAIITLGSKGSVASTNSKFSFSMPAITKTTVDTMGAGDAFLSISSPILYLTKSVELSSFAGNIAGAIQVGVEGLRYPLNKLKFLQYCNTLLKI